MSLLESILSWGSAELKPWQLDALRRLCQKQDLDSADYDELFAMLKSSHGLPDPLNLKPVPLAEAHLPVQAAGTSSVVIKAIRDLKHVNRIAPGQKLECAPKGLTVVYGPNASGKSGYSRVLKRACRARDLLETIHPNAFDPLEAEEIPEATFEIEVQGRGTSLTWKRDEAPPAELSTISVFDGRCARAYLDDEHDVAYRPYGLDILENLGQCVIPEVQKRLDMEAKANSTDASMFADLIGDTEAGRLVASLSATTDRKRVNELATLTGADTKRLAELERAFAEKDPITRAKDLRLRAKRLEGLISRIETAVAWVDEDSMRRLEQCDKEAVAASAAEITAASEFQISEPLLAGTGDEVWKNLFEAARRFSTESAYPEKAFPYVDADAQCVLCQQPLCGEAAQRMQRFDKFIKRDTARVSSEKRQSCQEESGKIKTASVGLALDVASTQELEELDAILLKTTQDFEKRIEARRSWMLEAFNTHDWRTPPPLTGNPRLGLGALSRKAIAQAADLEKTCDDTEKKKLEHERTELLTRVELSQRKKAITDLIERMQIRQKLDDCKNDLKTRPISDKAKDFADKAVTRALEDALNKEFAELGVGHVRVKLKHSVKQGKNIQKLVLDIPITTKMKINEVFSEGEQRAIAIGSFLAELHLAGHEAGIVFDDPVSSLDHHWRRNVAWRLVDEARTRQVIVLTHDTAFLGELLDALEPGDVSYLVQHLENRSDEPGYVSEGLPWEHQSYGARLDRLEKEQRSLTGSWPAYPSESDRKKMRQLYDDLRATIERVVQDVVFNGVVQRYRDWIKVGMLGPVACLTQIDCDEITALYNKCHTVVDAHDPSLAKGISVPGADQLGKDIDGLRAVIERIKTRRKQGNQTPAQP